jgi:hypothetical protein
MTEQELEFVNICKLGQQGALENFPLKTIILDGVPLQLFELLGGNYRDFIACLKAGGKAQIIFFDNMFTVGFEDLKGLSKEQFAKIPTGWLYDWGKVTGGACETQIENLINEKK